MVVVVVVVAAAAVVVAVAVPSPRSPARGEGGRSAGRRRNSVHG